MGSLVTHGNVLRSSQKEVNQNRKESHVDADDGRNVSEQGVSHALRYVHHSYGKARDEVGEEVLLPFVSPQPSQRRNCRRDA